VPLGVVIEHVRQCWPERRDSCDIDGVILADLRDGFQARVAARAVRWVCAVGGRYGNAAAAT
jgi:hypothetical protein